MEFFHVCCTHQLSDFLMNDLKNSNPDSKLSATRNEFSKEKTIFKAMNNVTVTFLIDCNHF